MIRSNFSAHPHNVVARDTLYNFGLQYGPKPQLHFYALPARGAAQHLGQVPLRHNVMLHDFMATERHLVALVTPVTLNLVKGMLGIGSPSDWFRYRPEDGTQLVILPIDAPERVRTFQVDPFFMIHTANGYEEADATVIDVSLYADAAVLDAFGKPDEAPDPGVITRFRIPHRGQRVEREQVFATPLEFPRLDPRQEGDRYADVFGFTRREGREGVGHLRFGVGEERVFLCERSEHLGEPVFVPRSQHAAMGDGYLLAPIYDQPSHTSHVAVFDTVDITDGPVARVHFDHHIPAPFHGIWVPD